MWLKNKSIYAQLFFLLGLILAGLNASCANNSTSHTQTAVNTKAQVPINTAPQATVLTQDTYSSEALYSPTQKPSVFLADIREQDLDVIANEARRATLPNWENIDKRAQRLRQRVLYALKEVNAPEELLFVPVAESGYNPYALSPTGALGLWQLMPRTAIELGARHRHGIDGRRHVEESSRAAAKHLLKLYQRFKRWSLALAAYNLGSWGVQRRLNKNPWQPSMGLDALPLPAETKHYVKQILGMVVLLERGEIQFSEPIQTHTLRINPPIDLVMLEKASGLEKNDLFRFNPELDYQHYLKRSVTLHLPQDNIIAIEQALHDDPNIFKPKFIRVRIKSGDSLWKIAHRQHTNIAYLRKLNPHLKNTLSIGHTIIVPAKHSFATAAHKANPLLASGRRIRYKVKSGDSLWTIAKKFGTSSKAIARINQISVNKLLRPGDRLWIVARFRPS